MNIKEFMQKEETATNLDIYGSWLIAFIGGVICTLITIYL